MADETLKEDDDKLEIVEVDEIPANLGQDTTPAADEGDDKPDGEDHLDEGEDDERLAQDREDENDKSPAAEKRRKRRALQKEARDRTLRTIDSQARTIAELTERVNRVEGVTISGRKETIEKDLAKAKRDLEGLDSVIAKAMEAGNGEDFVAAQRLRDQTRDHVVALEGQQKQLETPEQPRKDPRIASLAREWQEANPWYDGANAASGVVKRIDAGLTAEGWDPTSPDYWSELSKRTERTIKAASRTEDPEPRREQRQDNGQRKGPPLGGRSQDGAANGGNKVFVTPERKAAMQEAGIWDDPVRRTRALKEYADFDRLNTARN